MLPDQVEGAGGSGPMSGAITSPITGSMGGEARPRLRGIFHRQPGDSAAVRTAGNEGHRNLAGEAVARLRFDCIAAVVGSVTKKRKQRHGAIRYGVIVDVAVDIHD